jgi:high affinity sulfate transporter 1
MSERDEDGRASAGDEGRSPFRQAHRPSLLRRTVPVSGNLSHYVERNARSDLVAGITVAALAIPAGMAYAEIAGLSPVAGLYALLLPALAYALLGSSRLLSVGPEGALAVLVAAGVAPLVGDDPKKYAVFAAMVALLVGAVFIIARIVRLGWIADYFSRAVLVGYLHGIAVVLIVGQLGKVLGLSISASDPLPQLEEVAREISDADALTILVAVISLATLLILRWKAPRVPGPLVVVLGGILVSSVADLSAHGVAVVGSIPSGLPTLEWPSVGISHVLRLLPVALGIFAVCYADGVLTARSFAGLHGEHVDANQELLALGAANLAAGVTQAFPVGASGSRTAVNDQVGGRTQLVGVISAGVVAIVLLFLTEPVEKLPSACLGAVIIGAAIGLIQPADWRALAQVGRAQVLIAAATFVGVIAVGVLEALVVAVVLSILEVIGRSARPHDAVLGYVPRLGRWADVSFHPSARITSGVVVYRLDDRLFFANARYFKGRIREAVAGAKTRTEWLVFDADGMAGLDASGVEALEQTIDELARDDIVLVVARLKTPIRVRWDATGLTERVGADHLFPTVQAAVDAAPTRAE